MKNLLIVVLLVIMKKKIKDLKQIFKLKHCQIKKKRHLGIQKIRGIFI